MNIIYKIASMVHNLADQDFVRRIVSAHGGKPLSEILKTYGTQRGNVTHLSFGSTPAAVPKTQPLSRSQKWTMPSKFRLSSNIQPVGYSQSAYAATPKTVSTSF